MTNQEAILILKEIHSANQAIMLSSDNEGIQNSRLLDCKALVMAIEALEKVKLYEDLEEQGLLIKLPCKVGTKLYIISYVEDDTPIIEVETIRNIRIALHDTLIATTSHMLTLDEIGERGFIEKEEAEKRLAELEGGVSNE